MDRRANVQAKSNVRAHSYSRVAIASFLAAMFFFTVMNVAWQRELSQPAITLLGGGDRLSVLITSGEARLLIATGGDAVSFERALGAVQRPTFRRLDLLLTGAPSDLAMLEPGLLDAIRMTATLTPGDPDQATAVTNLPLLATPREIVLNDDLTVLLETRRATAQPAEAWSWRAIVRRGETAVILLSDAGASRLFAPVSGASALVVLADDPLAAWSSNRTPGLVFPDAALSPPAVRDLPADKPRPAYFARIFAGEAAPLVFTDVGLQMPSETVVLSAPDAGDDS